MKRKWKRLSSICLAALLVLMMPVSINATEEGWETGTFTQKTDSDSTQESQAETIESQDQIINEEQDNQDVLEQDDVQDDSVIEDSEPVSEQPLEEISLDPDENSLPSDENPLLSEQISLIPEDSVTTGPQTEPIFTTSDFDSMPVIELKYQGMNLTQALDVEIGYSKYINNCDQCVSISVSQGSLTALSYYLDNSGSNESMSEEQLSSHWQSADNLSYQEVKLSQDGKYVLYVKAVAGNGQTACVRTIGLVVDSIAPVITGIQNGGTYPLGTKFGVEDANLASVLVNEQPVSPSDDGQYQVAANGTSCVIRAKDMADHETIYSITIGGEKPDDPENPDNPDNPNNPDNPDN
ncbi:MAG: hypothetical protein HDR29_07595, partial [Lachnospiraceae bacterium]|nr:hypothetical protein [Lachnospiraceae bacterium]